MIETDNYDAEHYDGEAFHGDFECYEDQDDAYDDAEWTYDGAYESDEYGRYDARLRSEAMMRPRLQMPRKRVSGRVQCIRWLPCGQHV